MTLLRHWKIVFGLLLVFAAGAVTGSVATQHVIKSKIDHALNFEHWKAGVLHVLQSKLDLSPQQHSKLEFIVDARGREMRQCFSKAFEESGHVLVQLQAQIDQELTPHQRQVHAEMKRDFRTQLKKRFNFDLPPE